MVKMLNYHPLLKTSKLTHLMSDNGKNKCIRKDVPKLTVKCFLKMQHWMRNKLMPLLPLKWFRLHLVVPQHGEMLTILLLILKGVSLFAPSMLYLVDSWLLVRESNALKLRAFWGLHTEECSSRNWFKQLGTRYTNFRF